jgi:hypothetical protein
MMKRTLLVALALAVLPPAAARAEEAPPRWYGWEILLVDAAALGVMIAAGRADSDAVAWVGFGAYAAGGPLLHAIHGNGGRAATSGVLRVGLPLTLGLLASAACDGDGEEFLGCLGPVGGAMLGGAAIALIVDYAILAYEPARPPPVRVAVTPRPEGGLGFALAGSF